MRNESVRGMSGLKGNVKRRSRVEKQERKGKRGEQTRMVMQCSLIDSGLRK